MTIQIRAIDHFVLVVLDVDATVDFYRRATGIEARETAPGRWMLPIGHQKINLQELHHSVDPNTRHPTRGAGDFCLLTDTPIAAVVAHLASEGIALAAGPIRRTGSRHPLLSVYVYDPDENLVEIANEITDPADQRQG